jgi:sarcosine oxidase
MGSYDAIVLGLGAHGSAAAHHLGRLGRRVLGLERFARGHALGSSGGLSRVIRVAYFEHPSYVPLLKRAWQLWTELEQASGEVLLIRTGGVYVGRPGSEIVEGSTRSAREHQLVHEVLGASEIERRYPPFALEPQWVGLYEHQAGVLFPDRCIEAHLRSAERLGAELRFEEPANRWQRDGDGVRVATHRGTNCADRVVITTGAWLGELLPHLAPSLWVERVPLLWFEPAQPAPFAPERFPVYLIDTGEAGQFYGFPYLPSQGLKVARHHSGERVDPNGVDRSIRPADEERVRRFVRAYLPSGEGPRRHAMVCMYTNAPDGHFLIDRSPEHDGVVYASACSGHGFKFASVVGEVLAELCVAGRTRHPIEFFAASRLSA